MDLFLIGVVASDDEQAAPRAGHSGAPLAAIHGTGSVGTPEIRIS
jgi:hypothetical protein